MKNYFKLKKGFTLIELLVVIAIIGILAAVVLASLNTARGKGRDAATKSELSNLRAQAEIYYDDHSDTYGPAVPGCNSGIFADAGLNKIISAIGNGGSTTECITDGNTWAVDATLQAASGYWCVDSTGTSKQNSCNLDTSGSGPFDCDTLTC